MKLSVKPSGVVLLLRAIINEVSSITTFSLVSVKAISNFFYVVTVVQFRFTILFLPFYHNSESVEIENFPG